MTIKITEVSTIPLHEIPSLRDELRAELAQFQPGANGLLSDDDERSAGVLRRGLARLDLRERELQMQGGNAGKLMGLLPDIAGGRTVEPGARVIGGITPMLVPDEEVRSLFEGFKAGRPERFEIETRDVSALPMGVVSDYKLTPIAKLRERRRVASLMLRQKTDAASVTFYQQGAGTNAAAPVAEGGAKPESEMAYTPVAVTVRKLAHYVDVTKEALDDYANFAQIVQADGIAGLIDVENAQLLSGAGTGINIKGLLNATGILTYAPAGAEARYKSIRHGIAMQQAAHIEPDTIVLHPSDAETFDLSNDATAGLHANMSVNDEGARTAWNLRIVVTPGITAGTALLADFRSAAVVFEREAPSVFVDPYSQSANNIVRFIFEERLALGVMQPTALLKVTFNGAA